MEMIVTKNILTKFVLMKTVKKATVKTGILIPVNLAAGVNSIEKKYPYMHMIILKTKMIKDVRKLRK